MRGIQRLPVLLAVVDDQAVEVAPHHLESAQRPAEGRIHRVQKAAEVLEAVDGDQGCVTTARRRPETQDGPSHDTQRAFRTDEQLLEVIAGVVLDHVFHRGNDGAVGEHGLDPEQLLAGHSVANHAVAAGIG